MFTPLHHHGCQHNITWLSSHLIGAWVWDVDDSCSQLGLQVVYERCSEELGLAPDIVLVTPTRHGQQQAELTVTLMQKKGLNI